MGCLGKKPEVGKVMYLDDFGGNNCEKIEVWGDKQSWLCLDSGPMEVVEPHGWVVPAWGECGLGCQQLGSTMG